MLDGTTEIFVTYKVLYFFGVFYCRISRRKVLELIKITLNTKLVVFYENLYTSRDSKLKRILQIGSQSAISFKGYAHSHTRKIMTIIFPKFMCSEIKKKINIYILFYLRDFMLKNFKVSGR